MKFWDTSALIPLIIAEPQTSIARGLLEADPRMVLWWGTPLECSSALARSLREGRIESASHDVARRLCRRLEESAFEIQPSDELRRLASRLLSTHPLRAADSLQLAAALTWCRERPSGAGFVCLDRRLRQAADGEGFEVVPESF